MFTRANEPQSIGGVLDTGFKLFGAGLKQVWPITYLSALAGAIWGVFFQSAIIGSIDGTTGDLNFNIPALVIAYILIVIVGSIFMGAALYRIRTVYMGEESSFGQALAVGTRRAPAVIGATVLYMLASTIGTILLLIPGIYLSVTFAFAFYAAAADRQGPIQSLKYSFAIVKGNWWRTAGVLTIMLVIAFVFYFAAGLIAGIFIAVEDITPADITKVNFWSDIVIIPLVTAFVAALLYCLGYAVYHDLKLRSEGTDLAERIENLENA